ncbi:zinc metalloprotease [Flavivirga spongiicola]|uniref:Zinc metalloprotease n=1 Tax=Flavivirga spongiicola TaxID=421621 RepID=A0ABU7XWF8_9FLAO|nr:zinc metalloprotease [Flavivirga sp. MEBiC05379]MDO5979760.1 zinc metalloprotease [Flavivirga sp. MEBiC05379]
MTYKHLPFLIAIVLIVFCTASCSKDDNPPINSPIEEGDVSFGEVITIPVVVHVVNYTPKPFIISDEKIQSQIDVLNQDFRKKNPDHIKTPNEFIDLVADVAIEFSLATIDPDGNPTSGIIRTEGNVIGFDGRDLTGEIPIEDLKLYFTEKGGQDAWPRDKYLNIWIADLSDYTGELGLAGYAQFPNVDPRIDGVVIDPRVFGTLAPLNPGNELGRTATHEIGHWLNLRHIYGKNGDCEEGDLVDDTPNQKSQYSGSPTHPQNSCNSNDMFMNFMDYVSDQSMYMFTIGQKRRMRDLFNPGGLRRELYLNNKQKTP